MSPLKTVLTAVLLALLLAPGHARAVKVFINYSNQTSNPVCAGGVESTYAADNASRIQALLTGSGFQVQTSDDFYGSNDAAISWGAASFLSIHSNAGGGHGGETLRGRYADSTAYATKVQAGLMSKLPFASRGVKPPTCGTGYCRVLNYSGQTAALVEVVFHDCCTTSGYTGHPPSEGAYLVSTSGRQAISAGIAKGVCDYHGVSCTGGSVTPTTGQLIGLVYKNGDAGQRVSGATVKLSTNATTTSNATGVYTFDVPAGSGYSVTVSATGYKTVTKACPAVAGGGSTWCSVGLEALSAGTGKGFIKGTVCLDLANTAVDRVVPSTVTLSTGPSVNYNDSSTVWSFEVPAGSYTVTAKAEGYDDTTRSCPNPVVEGAISYCSVAIVKSATPTTGEIQGIVYQGGDTANHVAGATVTLNNGSTATYNGTDHWSFTLEPGTYTATVSASGYQTRTNVACPPVTTGSTAQCDLELQPEAVPDAGQPEVDAGQQHSDAGQQQADAGSSRDAGVAPASDASVPVGPPPSVPDTGCGCASGAGVAMSLFALPAMLLALRPRRRRG